jgi:hypothetical protein
LATAGPIGARSAANVSLPGPAGARALGLDDPHAHTLLQTFNRAETADVVRQLGWQICQARSNGAIPESDYYGLLADLIVRSTDVLKARASGAPAIAAAIVNVPLAPSAQPPKPEKPARAK